VNDAVAMRTAPLRPASRFGRRLLIENDGVGQFGAQVGVHVYLNAISVVELVGRLNAEQAEQNYARPQDGRTVLARDDGIVHEKPPLLHGPCREPRANSPCQW